MFFRPVDRCRSRVRLVLRVEGGVADLLAALAHAPLSLAAV
jgi:hypothetical protein